MYVDSLFENENIPGGLTGGPKTELFRIFGSHYLVINKHGIRILRAEGELEASRISAAPVPLSMRLISGRQMRSRWLAGEKRKKTGREQQLNFAV